MFKDIKEVFEIHLKNVKYDTTLYQKLKVFRINWATKSDEYIEFLGSNLLGLHDVRFSSRDEETLFNDILNIDYNNLRDDIYSVKGINKNWKVSSNPTYLTLTYIMHMYIKEGSVGKKLDDVLMELYLIYAYKVISSLISHGFKHKVKESVAKAAYERLSKRYLIRRLGSWQKVFEYRALDVIPPNGYHIKSLKNYNTDTAILITNDLQGRIRDTFKQMYSVMIEIIDEDVGINTTTLIDKNEEGESLKAITGRQDVYVMNIENVIDNPNDFIHNDTLVLVSTILPNLDPDMLKTTLLFISNNNKKLFKNNDTIKNIIVLSLKYINSKGYTNNYMNDIMDILYLVKSYWNSSRVIEKEVSGIKKDMYNLIVKATGKKTKWVVVTTTIGTILYIFLRSLIKKTY